MHVHANQRVSLLNQSKTAFTHLPLHRHMSNPWVCQAACHLIGEYAAWFGKAEGAPWEGALRLLLCALRFPQSWRHAAHAFRNICVRCKDQLLSGPVSEHQNPVRQFEEERCIEVGVFSQIVNEQQTSTTREAVIARPR